MGNTSKQHDTRHWPHRVYPNMYGPRAADASRTGFLLRWTAPSKQCHHDDYAELCLHGRRIGLMVSLRFLALLRIRPGFLRKHHRLLGIQEREWRTSHARWRRVRRPNPLRALPFLHQRLAYFHLLPILPLDLGTFRLARGMGCQGLRWRNCRPHHCWFLRARRCARPRLPSRGSRRQKDRQHPTQHSFRSTWNWITLVRLVWIQRRIGSGCRLQFSLRCYELRDCCVDVTAGVGVYRVGTTWEAFSGRTVCRSYRRSGDNHSLRWVRTTVGCFRDWNPGISLLLRMLRAGPSPWMG